MEETEIEMAHDYLRYQWYNYECADKTQVEQIIQEELKQNPNERFDRTMMRIKRRCMQEC